MQSQEVRNRMPFLSEEELLDLTISAPEIQEEPTEVPESTETPKSSFSETVSAFYKLEDPVFNATKEWFAPSVSSELDTNFNPIDRLQAERPELVGDYVDNFVTVRNEEEYNRKLLNIDYELEQKEIISNASGLTAISAGLTSAVADPINLLVYPSIAIKASKLGNVGRGLATGTAAGAIASTSREAILQGTQETRTLDESAFNIIAESTLGGLLGAGAAALTNPAKVAAKDVLSKTLQGKDFKFEVAEDSVKVVPESSIGAQQVTSEFDELGISYINENIAKVLSGPEFLRAPDLRAALSPSESVRKVGERFYNSPYLREKHKLGKASGPRAQNAIFRGEMEALNVTKQVDQLYTQHTGRSTILGNTTFRPTGKVSLDEYNSRIWKNLTDNTRIDDIAEVNKSAKLIRSQMDDLTRKLQEAEIIPKDIDSKFASNYMMRVYDLDKLQNPATRAKFTKKVGNWLRTHKVDGSMRKNMLNELDAEEEAEKLLSSIRGENVEQVPMGQIADDMVSKAKFTKKRHFLIPDSEVEEFLVTDASRLFSSYSEKANKLLYTNRALKDSGYKNIEDLLAAIDADAEKALNKLGDSAVDAAEAARIGRKFEKERELAKLMYRSMLGQLRKPGSADRFFQTLLNYQFVRLLGGVTISSLPEMVMLPIRKGFVNTFKDGYMQLITNAKVTKASKDQMHDLSGALELESNNILRALAGTDNIENYGRNGGSWDRAMSYTTKKFSQYSLIAPWTSFQRRLATQVSSADLTRKLARGPKGSEIEELAAIGIGKKDYARLQAQIKKHSQQTRGTWLLNPHLWDDESALEIMKNAIQVDVESTILRPGVESIPFAVQKSLAAKTIFQFKSFMSGATGKITISGIQRRDATILGGLISIIAMGSVVEVLKDKIAGREAEYEPEELFLSGVSRSGVGGLVATTLLDLGLNFYNEKTRRFAADNASSVFLGPSAGQIETIIRTMQRVSDGEVSDADKKAVTRMLPFMNLFYIKALTDRAFDEE